MLGRKRYLWVVVIAAAIVAACGLWILDSRKDDERHPKELRDWLKSSGYTLDSNELNKRLDVPESENAAELILALVNEFTDNDKLLAAIDSGEPVIAVSNYHINDSSIYDQLKNIAAKASCYFERDWDSAIVAEYPEFGVVSKGSQYLGFLAQADIRTGNYEMALERLTVLDRLAGHMRSESWNALVFQFGARRHFIETLGAIISENPTDSAVHEFVTNALSIVRSNPDLENALQGALITAVHGVRNYNIDDLGSDWMDTVKRGPGKELPSPSFLQDAEQYLLALFSEEYAAMQLPTWPERIAASEKISAVSLKDVSAPAIYLSIIRPINSIMYSQAAKDESYFEMLRMLPQILASDDAKQFDNTVTDPATGKFFRVVAADGGFKLYSVGFDGVDGGGPMRPGYDPGNSFRQGYDFGFWIELGE